MTVPFVELEIWRCSVVVPDSKLATWGRVPNLDKVLKKVMHKRPTFLQDYQPSNSGTPEIETLKCVHLIKSRGEALHLTNRNNTKYLCEVQKDVKV